MHALHQHQPDHNSSRRTGFPHQVTASWVKAFERSLESLLWRLYAEASVECEKHVLFVADAAAAGLKSEKVVMLDAPEGMQLMFCGPVSTEPSLNCRKVAELGNGLVFYVHPTTAPPSGEIIVPAWMAKATPKKDVATLEPDSAEMTVYVTEDGEVSTQHPHEFLKAADKCFKGQQDARACLMTKAEHAREQAKKFALRLKKVKKTITKVRSHQQKLVAFVEKSGLAVPQSDVEGPECESTLLDAVDAEAADEKATDTIPTAVEGVEGQSTNEGRVEAASVDKLPSDSTKEEEETEKDINKIPAPCANGPGEDVDSDSLDESLKQADFASKDTDPDLPSEVQHWRRKQEGKKDYSGIPEVMKVDIELHWPFGSI